MQTMERKASDNRYLHREFHSLLNLGLQYLEDEYGEQAVCEYLQTFAKAYYQPLIAQIQLEGFPALRKHITHVYAVEDAPEDVSFVETEKQLTVIVKKCPAISYMLEKGVSVYHNYFLTSSLIYGTIADAVGYQYQMQKYDIQTGRAVHIFQKES